MSVEVSIEIVLVLVYISNTLDQACPTFFVRGSNKGFFCYLRAARPWICHGTMLAYLGLALTCSILDYTLQKNHYIFI